MSESTSLREAIARALHRQATDDGEVHELWGGVSEHEEEVAEWLPFADAVLAVLADLPDDVIERAALALIDRDGFEPDLLLDVSRSEYRSDARAAFTAAFGGEQA